MFPFWDVAIAPILEAIRPKRVVEIGALRGDTTKLMLDHLGDGVELHVIDPVPDFDPAEHETAFPGRYIFHRDLSLGALPDMDPMDVALIDGDHNWYTVYNEMKQLSETARGAGAALPVMLCHDVLWPYGRRDLYYDPSNIPAEHRQPYDQLGIARDKSELKKRGGVNPTLHNADHEGGPRNGVMSGIEDFIAEYDKPIRLIVLPIYFGLAIVVEEELVARLPELERILDYLESAEGRLELLELAESERLRIMVSQHDLHFRVTRQVRKLLKAYLNNLKGSLLDEHYIENELRITHLLGSLRNGTPMMVETFRTPSTSMRAKSQELLAIRRAGSVDAELGGSHPTYLPYTPIGRTRLDQLEGLFDSIRLDGVKGDFVDCGAGRGGIGIFMRGYLTAHSIGNRKVWVADRFRAYRDADVAYIDAQDDPDEMDNVFPVEPILVTTDPTPQADKSSTDGHAPIFEHMQSDLNGVREAFARFDLLDHRDRFLQGDFLATLSKAKIKQLAFVHIGEGAVEDASDILRVLYPQLNEGGYVLIENYEDPEVQALVDGYRANYTVTEQIRRVGAAAFWRKKHEPVKVAESSPIHELGSRIRRRIPAKGSPLVTIDRSADKDLSVIVCFYNMKREAARTLRSLARNYQRDIGKLDYEVIVVENGSDADQKLGAEYVQSFGREFRYIDMGDDAQPSPVNALNRGLEVAGGSTLALMIDGAHLLTPGVLHYGMAATRDYAPAVVLTQQFYMGPGQQGETMGAGYDQAFEDRLFNEIHWPQDGYDLFKVGHFIGGRDWFDGQWESNCLFVPRELIDQTGGFDESFVEPGGGFANLEFFERVASTPNVKLATMLGEGSFHQIHGGTTTNEPASDERYDRIMSYAGHFAELRGKGFFGPRKPMHFVGSIFDNANRTRGRRRTALRFFKLGAEGDPDGPTTKAEPIPEDVTKAFVEAYWRNHGTTGLQWLGTPITEPPTDLFAYQGVLADVRPDWVIETGSGNGSRALFLASIFDLLGHGQVLSIDTVEDDARPQHDRIRFLTVDQLSGDATRAQVDEIIGTPQSVVVILGSHSNRQATIDEFGTFSDLVPVNSYVIVESTIFGGHPVWPSFGAGPIEGVKTILGTHRDFVVDPLREPRGFSYNPGGYLRRST